MANTSKGVLFLPPSDAYVRSFLYLLYTLIKLYYTKALSDQASSLARIEFSSRGQESQGLWVVQQQPFNASPPCPSPTPRVYSDSCPLSQWCHPTILSSVISFSSYLQSFPALGYFPMNKFFSSGDQSIGVSASASVLPMNIQDWFPLGWTGWISLQSKRLSRVFSNTTVQKHQFFGTQFSL